MTIVSYLYDLAPEGAGRRARDHLGELDRRPLGGAHLERPGDDRLALRRARLPRAQGPARRTTPRPDPGHPTGLRPARGGGAHERGPGAARAGGRRSVRAVRRDDRARKEHLVALAAFDELAAAYPDVHLVLAGRKGWIEDDTIETITSHPSYGERVHWLRSPSDALLAELYRRATACLYLSKYEGFGLPIAEALAHGRVTVASRNSSMYEVGGDSCDYTWHTVAPEVAETLGHYLGDPALLAARERHIRETFRPLDWDTVTGTIGRALRGLGRAEQLRSRPRPAGLQLVCLSDDADRLGQALALWDDRSRAVAEYVVVVPPALLDEVRALETRVPLVAVDERSLVSGREAQFGAADRRGRVRMLRAGLADLPGVDEVFVLADDDQVPLAEVGLDAFVGAEGRMSAYFFHDLTRWPHPLNDFDDEQRAVGGAAAPGRLRAAVVRVAPAPGGRPSALPGGAGACPRRREEPQGACGRRTSTTR